MIDLTSLTARQIDALWAPIATRENNAWTERYLLRDQLRNAEIALVNPGRLRSWELSSAQQAVTERPAQIEKLDRVIEQAHAEQAPFRTEWNRRSGWTRAYLVVTNGQGHVHQTRSCSTCYPTTQFIWLIEQSGMSEQEIVDLAGERACTVCYASAPVALRLDQPTRLFSDDEKRRQVERAERVTLRAVKDSQAVLTETGAVLYKTERGATNAIAAELSSMVHYGPTHPSFTEWKKTVDDAVAGLARRGVEFDYDAALEKARTKERTEHRKFRKTAQFEDYRRRGYLDDAALADNYDPVKF